MEFINTLLHIVVVVVVVLVLVLVLVLVVIIITVITTIIITTKYIAVFWGTCRKQKTSSSPGCTLQLFKLAKRVI